MEHVHSQKINVNPLTLITLQDREFATILASLRLAEQIQAKHSGRIPGGGPFGEDEFADMEHFEPDCTPLTAAEISDLCERLNFSCLVLIPTESSTPLPSADDLDRAQMAISAAMEVAR